MNMMDLEPLRQAGRAASGLPSSSPFLDRIRVRFEEEHRNVSKANHTYQQDQAPLQPLSIIEPLDKRLLVIAAIELYRLRRTRAKSLPKQLVGEPGWDMLLALFVSEGDQSSCSVSSVCHATAAPYTTALRWIDYLQKEELVQRTPHISDARSSIITLTNKGRAIMEQCLSAMLKSNGR